MKVKKNLKNKELLKAFNVKSEHRYEIKDYQAFKDKELLDKFRIDILEDLSDKGFIDEYINSRFNAAVEACNAAAK